jgi:hypothetical protein
MAIVRHTERYKGKLIEPVSAARALAISKLLKDPSKASQKDQKYLQHVKSVHFATPTSQDKPPTKQGEMWYDKL